jgi:hypothetical protein
MNMHQYISKYMKDKNLAKIQTLDRSYNHLTSLNGIQHFDASSVKSLNCP